MDRTDPMLLPFEVPTISDFQRAKVLRAEHELSSGEPAAQHDAVVAAVQAASEQGGGLLTVEFEGRSGVVYTRESKNAAHLVVGEGANMHSVLRGTAHHLVHPVFPPHGVEWVMAFLRNLEQHASPAAAAAYREAYSDLEVHVDPSVRRRRVRKSALGAVNKERGVLARVVADEEPESIVCQLLEIVDNVLVVANAAGERALDLGRLRYLSYKLTTA